MQIIKGGVEDLNSMTNLACEEAFDYMSDILVSLEYLKFRLDGGQLTQGQFNVLREEVHTSD